jgi:hypothetical protein
VSVDFQLAGDTYYIDASIALAPGLMMKQPNQGDVRDASKASKLAGLVDMSYAVQ